jgi:hypothetical protein
VRSQPLRHTARPYLLMISVVACERSASTAPTKTTTEPHASATVGHRSEVVRIDQDLHPNDAYEIVLDGFVTADALVDVQMGWVDTADADRRSPFGRGVRRHLELDLVRRDAQHWDVRLGTAAHSWTIAVERDATGSVRALADVRTGTTIVERCRIRRGVLHSTKVFGLPVGLRRIQVSCTDGDGVAHEGELVESGAS